MGSRKQQILGRDSRFDCKKYGRRVVCEEIRPNLIHHTDKTEARFYNMQQVCVATGN